MNQLAIHAVGDYSGNHVVDAANYTLWRDTFGKSVSPHGAEADGNTDGMINDADFTFWKNNFGNPAGAGRGGLAAAAPEPTTILLSLAALAVAGWIARRRIR